MRFTFRDTVIFGFSFHGAIGYVRLSSKTEKLDEFGFNDSKAFTRPVSCVTKAQLLY